MKNLNYKELIAYASAFVSFVMPKVDVDEIILFGSVARNEADKKSDVDLFFDLKRMVPDGFTAEVYTQGSRRVLLMLLKKPWRQPRRTGPLFHMI